MNDLERKYIDDELTKEELPALREHLAESTDDDVAATLEEVWNGDIDSSGIRQDRLDGIKERIDNTLGLSPQGQEATGQAGGHGRMVARRWLHGAAAAVLLFFISATIYLYFNRADTYYDPITFTTGKGERAVLTLPDGTKVTLGYDSRLAYTPSGFSPTGRRVTLSGEAYFDVAKAGDSPFIVSDDNLEVKVLGTKFDLQLRRNRPFARLTLDEGGVLLTSVKTGQSASISPGNTATLDYASGGITVRASDTVGDMKAWMDGVLNFKNEPFIHVLRSLEEAYDISIKTSGSIIADSFTGTLPTSNIAEAIRILGTAYGLRFSIDGTTVTLSTR